MQELLAEVEREKQREKEQRKRAGLDVKEIEDEDEEDYMGVGPLIEKLEKEKLKSSGDLNMYEERTDSDSDEDDERFTTEAVKKRAEVFEKKFKRHGELLNNFAEAGNLLIFEIFCEVCVFLFSVFFSATIQRVVKEFFLYSDAQNLISLSNS